MAHATKHDQRCALEPLGQSFRHRQGGASGRHRDRPRVAVELFTQMLFFHDQRDAARYPSNLESLGESLTCWCWPRAAGQRFLERSTTTVTHQLLQYSPSVNPMGYETLFLFHSCCFQRVIHKPSIASTNAASARSDFGTFSLSSDADADQTTSGPRPESNS